MIRFRCHRCKRNIAAPDGHVGKKVKCPACLTVTIVPDIPGAQKSRARSEAASRAAAAPPPLPIASAPRGPLDELAAAMGGDVETAAFDDQYVEHGEYEAYDGRGQRAPAPQEFFPVSSKRFTRMAKAPGASGIEIAIAILFPVIGLILGFVRMASDKRGGGQLIGISLVMLALIALGVLMRLTFLQGGIH